MKSYLSNLRPLAVNLALLAVSLCCILLALEVFLRVANIQPMSVRQVYLHRPSDVAGLVYEFIPNLKTEGFGGETITINSQGFRSPELDPAKPTIAVVGDSYAFGYGVEDDETNPAVLAKDFPSYNVLNTGVNGYNIEQETLLFKTRIAPLKPKLVIVEFVWNDMDPKGHFDPDGIVRMGTRTQAEDDVLLKKSISRPGLLNFPGKLFLQKRSALFNFIEKRTKSLSFRRKLDDITVDSVTQEKLDFYEHWFHELSAAASGSRKLFVIWPEPNLHLASRERLKIMAAKEDFRVLDLYDTLGNIIPSLGWDDHPTAAVQTQAAEAMADTIRHWKLLD